MIFDKAAIVTEGSNRVSSTNGAGATGKSSSQKNKNLDPDLRLVTKMNSK